MPELSVISPKRSSMNIIVWMQQTMEDCVRLDAHYFPGNAENLKPRIRALTGKTPSTLIARDVGVCLQQGRLFFESAERSDLAIRPLLLFYGTLAFAKALVVGRALQAAATLPQSHGVSDVSSSTARVTELEVRIGSSGTFQRFNDVVARLNRFTYFDRENMTQGFLLRAASSAQLDDVRFTLKEILSRIPGLQGIYQRTFNEPANTEPLSTANPSNGDSTYWEFRIDDRELFSDRASLQALVQNGELVSLFYTGSVSSRRSEHGILQRRIPKSRDCQSRLLLARTAFLLRTHAPS
jgi:YaaC-like Protein